jgi:putative membrane protein
MLFLFYFEKFWEKSLHSSGDYSLLSELTLEHADAKEMFARYVMKREFMEGTTMKQGSFLVHLVINALAFLIVSSLYAGMTVKGVWAAVIAALLWGIINALLRPFLILLTLPINILTFGLFTLVINGLILFITDLLYSGLELSGFFAGIVAALLLSLVNVILSTFLVRDKDR